jgi:hypothetical protein
MFSTPNQQHPVIVEAFHTSAHEEDVLGDILWFD